MVAIEKILIYSSCPVLAVLGRRTKNRACI